MEIVLFEIGDVRYALPAAQVREIVRAVAILPLPGAPPVVEGVVDVRGQLAPVLDLRARFDEPSRPVIETDHFVLATAGTRLVVVRADRVTDLTRIDPSDIHDAAALAGGRRRARGVARLPDGLVLIHDLRAFLEESESRALDQALAGTTRVPTAADGGIERRRDASRRQRARPETEAQSPEPDTQSPKPEAQRPTLKAQRPQPRAQSPGGGT